MEHGQHTYSRDNHFDQTYNDTIYNNYTNVSFFYERVDTHWISYVLKKNHYGVVRFIDH